MTKPRILLIDFFNVLIAQNAVSFLSDYNGNPCGMYLTAINQIKVFAEKFKPQKILVLLDGPEAGARRRSIYPNYKNKRRVTERVSKVQLMDDGDNMVFGVEGAFQNQLIKVYEMLKLLPVTILSVPECEADDMIAYLTLKNKDEFDNIIISNDKDYLQLIQPGISVYRWKTKVLFTHDEFVSEHKILPSNYIYKKILLGDSSDLVEGIKGIGKKAFDNFANELNTNTFEGIDKFFDHFSAHKFETYSTRERNAFLKAFSIENKPVMELLYKVMKLNEDCMQDEQTEILKAQIEEQLGKAYSRFSARIKLQQNGFNKLYNGFNEDKWLQPFTFIKNSTVINV